MDSWENDLDLWCSKILDGLTKKEAAFYVDVCRCIQQKENSNLHVDGSRDELYSQFTKVCEKHNISLSSDKEEDTEGALIEALQDVGLLGNNLLRFTRNCVWFKVMYVPETIEFPDVISEFENPIILSTSGR
mgnify:CR=1 FL=1